MRTVDPLIFSIWQRGTSLGPWLLSLGLIIGIVISLQRFLNVSWLEIAAEGVVGAVGTIGYVAWAVSNDWNGLVRTPRRAWNVSFDGLILSVKSNHLKTDIPLECIRSACIVAEGSWDTLKGVEDMCLVLQVRNALQISVPGSSEGFYEVRRALDALIGVGFRELGVD